MKTMTCKQLGGACDVQFHADSFEEMVEQSINHGLEMAMQGDESHFNAMNILQETLGTPQAMKEWYENKRNLFDDLPEEEE